MTQRGLGRRIIFEDDDDRRAFLEILRAKAEPEDVDILAWCLMDNHVHMIVRCDVRTLSKLMQRLSISYAQRFNGRHGHVGKVFQNRFRSQPIKSNEHLLSAIRYIHLNSRDAGFSSPDRYAWSSYRECVGCEDVEGAGICDVAQVLAIFDGADAFMRFHEEPDVIDGVSDFRPLGFRISDSEAKEIAVRQLGSGFADQLLVMSLDERNKALRLLKDLGLSVRQIERITGIGRGIIARA